MQINPCPNCGGVVVYMRLKNAWSADGRIEEEDCTEGFACSACHLLWSSITIDEQDLFDSEIIETPFTLTMRRSNADR